MPKTDKSKFLKPQFNNAETANYSIWIIRRQNERNQNAVNSVQLRVALQLDICKRPDKCAGQRARTGDTFRRNLLGRGRRLRQSIVHRNDDDFNSGCEFESDLRALFAGQFRKAALLHLL